MTFEFVTSRNFDFIKELGSAIGIQASDNRLDFDDNIGTGFIKKIVMGPVFNMVLHRFQLKETLTIKRRLLAGSRGMVTIAFYLHEKPVVFLKNRDDENNTAIHLSAIHITSTNIEIETRFPQGAKIHSTVLVVPAELLPEFLPAQNGSSPLNIITSGSPTFWFDSQMTPQIQNVLKQIDQANDDGVRDALYYKIKTQELIYLLFTTLLNEDLE